jgi:hypothetical protein
MRALKSLVVILLAVAFAISCETASEPEYAIPDINLNQNPVRMSAVGSGQSHRLYSPDVWRTFSFNVRKYLDDTVDGMFQWNNHGGNWGSADAICMQMDGNRAWIGGIVTRHSNTERIGEPAVFRLEDNGQGVNAVPDKISYVLVGPDAENYCAEQYSSPYWVRIEAGNVVLSGPTKPKP